MKNNIFKLSKVAVALLPLCYVTHAFAAEDDTKKETTEVAATATAEEKSKQFLPMILAICLM